MSVFGTLIETKTRKGGGFFLLLDPDRVSRNRILELAEAAGECRVDAVLVGTSFTLSANFHRTVREIKESTTAPVIIFPGAHSQISPFADAILFTTLLSGRNPQYLIDEQVRGAPIVKEQGVEPIATGYILIESGKYTSVQYISNSMPIPSDKHDIVCAHALAAQYMGMQMIFLEAGSGARNSVPEVLIESVAEYVDIPMIVGGGIKDPEDVEKKIRAGASFVVVGHRFESGCGLDLLREFSEAAHPLQQVEV